MGAYGSTPATCDALARGIPVSSGGTVKHGWWAALTLGGQLYCVPCSAERLLVYNPSGDCVDSVDTRMVATGEGKWRAAAAVGRKVFGIPDRADSLLVYDIQSRRVSGVSTASIAKGYFKWQSAVVLGGRVYAVPFHADKILVYDPATRQVSSIAADDPRKPGPSKWLASVVVQGKLVGVPADASALLIYDPVVKRVTYVDIQGFATCQLKWLAAVVLDGRLYAIPCHADCILIYDPGTGKATSISTAGVATGPGKWLSAVSHDGKIYGIPDHADQLLVFDPATGDVSGIDVSAVATGPFKWQSAVVLGGRVYAVPHRAGCILVYDPATGEISSCVTAKVVDAACPAKWGQAATLHGCVCGVPYDAAQLLVFQPERGSPCGGIPPGSAVATDLPRNAPAEFVRHFVAAWLSHWIYHVGSASDPAPIGAVSVGGEAVEFTLHWVHEEPLSGSPARLATVTAALPWGAGKVLYVPFKGSSNLTDFIVNASVLADYSPFDRAFGDRQTFVHHGAYHAIAQLRVHRREALQKVLVEAADAGVEQLIVTGHSLGGQYALAFLLDTFLELRATAQPPGDVPPHPLLENVQCVVFGSPMCFGASEGAEVRRDFAEFVFERSVNYITPGDPVPRLWSELDIEGFVQYFANYLQDSMGAMTRRAVEWAVGSGGLARKAEELLKRPDISSQLLQPGKLYLHLSRIRLLTSTGFRAWRPLAREHIILEDHSLDEVYIPGLRSAMDPALPGNYVLFEGGDGRCLHTTAEAAH